MSRFEDTLQRDLAVIADRATPSPDAWQQILVRIVDQEPIEETEIIMLVENQERPRRWPVYAAAAAVVALVAAGIALVAARDDGETPADDPTPVTTLAPENVDEEGTPVDDAETETVDEPVDDPVEAAEPVTTAAPEVVDEVAPADLLPPAGQVAEGRYATDYIGTDLTFEVTSAAEIPWNTLNQPGRIWLYTGAGDEFVQITRFSGWYDADQAVDPATVGVGTIAPGDIDGLIAERPDMLIDDLGETEVGGRTARLFEFSLDPASTAGEGICDPAAQPCTWLVSSSADGPGDEAWRATPSLLSGRLVRAFVIEMDGYEPILVEGSTTRDDKEAWLDEVFQPIVDSIELGEPTHAVEGGRASLTTSVVAIGTWTDAGYTETPRDDGSFDVTYVTTLDGDIRAESVPTTAYRTPDPSGGSIGGGRFVLTGDIDGLGSGTIEFREEFVSLPGFLSVGVITGGSGDMEGATGWALFNPNSQAGTYEFHIDLPEVLPAEVATDTVVVESEFAVGELFERAGADGATLTSGAIEFTGELAGDGAINASSTSESVGSTRGFATRWVAVTVDGVGTGAVLLEGPFRQDDTGNYVGLANVVAGSGDLTGATGTVRFQSADGGVTGTATFELEIPTG